MLTSFTLENFKSFREPATLPLAPLTMLAGANASGKSNLVEALRLLSWIAQGHRLTTIRHALQDANKPIRGTLKNLGFEQSDRFSFSFDAKQSPWSRYSVTLEYDHSDDELYIAGAALTGAGQNSPLFQVIGQCQDGSIGIRYNNFKPGPNPTISVNAQMSVLLQMQNLPQYTRRHSGRPKLIPRIAAYYRSSISGITFLDPIPSSMRGYSFKVDKTLNDDGSNISGVVFNLCQNRESKETILDFTKFLPEQDICDIKFIETPRNEVMVELMETFGAQESLYDASLLSDGTLRVLAIAAIALSAKEGSLVVVEEIDNGIHPSRAEGLLRRLADIAQERNLRLLLTTHNPALLDALPEEAMPDVVFCFRDPETGASRLTPLGKLHDYPKLVAQGGLGSLMTHGVIDRFVKDFRTPEQRKEDALAWLRELKAETG